MAVAVKRPARRIRLSTPARPGAPQLRASAANPYPSAPQATRAVNTPGGPALKPTGVKKTTGRVGPGTNTPAKKAGVGRGPGGNLRIIRGPKMALRVGVPKLGLRGTKVVQRTQQARKHLAGPGAKRTVITGEHGERVIKTAGRTKIVGKKGNVLVVRKAGSKFINKKAGTVTKQRMTKAGRNRIVKTWGGSTATKADDARAVKVRGKNRGRLTYTGPGGRTTTVARRAGTPRKIRVTVKGPGGNVRVRKVIGAKRTKTIRGGKTTVGKTRYISQERRNTVTPRVGEKGWARGNTRPAKKAAARPGNRPRSNVPTNPHPAGSAAANAWEARGTWQDTARFRRLRRKQGARYNQSVTKGQLAGTTSRRLS